MASVLRINTCFESLAMLDGDTGGDTGGEYWQRVSAIDEDRRELRLQESIANEERSLELLQEMISGSTDAVSEFLSRYKQGFEGRQYRPDQG